MMQRRVLVTGIILAITFSVIVGLLVTISRNNTSANPIRLIPQDALAVIRINGSGLFQELQPGNSSLWDNISELPVIEDLNSQIEILDSLARKDSDIWKLLFQSGFLISGHYDGGKRLSFLSLVNLPSEITEKELLKLVEKTASFSEEDNRKYEGITIYSFLAEQADKQNYFFAMVSNTVILSKSAILIEDAIRQSSLTNSLLDSDEFSSIMSTAGKNKPANLFIDFRKQGKLLIPLLNNQFGEKSKNYTKFGGWAEMDLNIGSDFLLLNGLISTSDSTHNFLSVLTEENPVKMELDQVLPSDINTLIAFGITNPKKSFKAYQGYLREMDKYNKLKERINAINKELKVDIEDFLFALIENEICVAQAGTGQISTKDYILIKCKSGSTTKKKFEELLGDYTSNNSGVKLSYDFAIDNDIERKIFKMPIENFCGKMFGSLFDVFEENYFTVIGNYLVFSDSKSSISKIIYDNLLNRTLNTDESYKDFCSNLSQKSYMLFYTNLSRSTHFFQPYLDHEILNSWEENIDIFQKSQVFGFQISSVSNMAYASVLFKNSENVYDKPRTVWESQMDTLVNAKPHFVVNHYTKQNEIFIQDLDNTIYLVNQAGRILWKQKLKEQINSEIFQIDYFKNGKLQLMFSTANSIHLIDRNGNYVERYPIRLRAASTAGMSLFDYEKNRNYRIFIPCNDKKIYAYSVDGSILSGWQFGFSDHIVETEVQHFRVEGKDFIVFGDRTRIYALDRRGNTRIDLTTQFAKSRNNKFHLSGGVSIDKSHLLTTDSSGSVRSISFDGVVISQKFKELSSDHFFEYKDVDADGNRDFIFLDANTISIYQDPSNLVFTKSFNETIGHRPVYYHFSANDRKIGLVSEKDQKIYLLNNSGELYKGFPLEGATLFSIGYFNNSNSKFNLIVGGRNNFLYNYAVE